MTQRDKLIQQFGLTPSDVTTIVHAGYQTWCYIGGDVLQAVADDKGKSVDAVTVSRAEVIELVLDADRIDDALQPRRKVMNDILPTDPLSPAGRALIRVKYDTEDARQLMQLLMRDAFPYTRYGM